MTNNNEEKHLILKKRLNTFKNSKGSLFGVPNDLVIDILRAWEGWTGSSKSFYQSIGVKKEQLSFLIKKGKKLFKDGKEKLGPFIPVEIKPSTDCPKAPMILNLDRKKSIRFYQVDHLVEFLKKAA